MRELLPDRVFRAILQLLGQDGPHAGHGPIASRTHHLQSTSPERRS
jgi:hypothetical protein